MGLAGTVTVQAATEIYGVLSADKKTFTIRYDAYKSANKGVTPDDWGAYEWMENKWNVETLVIDPSMDNVRPTSVAYWFDGFFSATSIQNIQYLHTDEVTDMTWLFNECMRLTEIDLSHFNTSKVTKMKGMFRECKAVEVLNFNWFDMKNVKDTRDMFNGCSGLTQIQCIYDWSILSVTQSTDMFKGCTKLKGGYGTTFDSYIVDIRFARPDKSGQMGYFCANEVYGVLSENGKTFTIRYDPDRWENKGVKPDEWIDYSYMSQREKIEEVIFHSSMADAHLTSTANWFESFTSLSMLYNLNYFVTDEVTDMSYMFAYCSNLAPYFSLNYLNIQNLVKAKGMFLNCTSLIELHLADFNMSKLEDATKMFSGCTNLKTIVTNRNWSLGSYKDDDMFKGCTKLTGGKGTAFDAAHTGKEYARPDGGTERPGYFTSKNELYGVFSSDGKTFTIRYGEDRLEWNGVYDGKWAMSEYTNAREKVQKVVIDVSVSRTSPTYIYSWFEGFTALTEIEHLENLRTEKVTDMDYLFRNCRSLEVLDLRPLSFEKVETAYAMFAHCTSLKTIYCNVDLRNRNTLQDTRYMFYDCPSLVGGKGAVYNEDQIEKAYAHVDYGENDPGYFTRLEEMYGHFSGTDLYLYHDSDRFNREFYRDEDGTLKNTCLLPEEWMDESQAAKRSKVETVHFDFTMDDANLTSTAYWFEGFSSLKNFDRIDYFYTDKVTDMSHMFANCYALDTMDLHTLEMKNVTNLEAMFLNCKALKMADVQTVDISKVTDASRMFAGCESLETILCNIDWSTYDFNGQSMFDGCTALKGMAETPTVYDAEHTDKAYARPDGGTELPGYFTAVPEIYGVYSENGYGLKLTLYYDNKRQEREGKLNWHSGVDKTTVNRIDLDKSMQDARPTSTARWFKNFKGVIYINYLDYLNTSEVTTMEEMFYQCENVKEIDIRNFDMRKVKDMEWMFAYCTRVKSILMPTSYIVENVRYMRETFAGCQLLEEIDLHAFDTKKVTNMYYLFWYDQSLKTIYCEEDWSQRDVLNDEETSRNMFYKCTSLVGSAGTAYDENFVGKAYARPDGGTEAPGYFTPFPGELYGVYSSTGDTLTLYFDKQRVERGGIFWTLNIYDELNSNVRLLILDESVKEARPTDCSWWFSDFTQLRRIEHLDYLNTSEVTDMSGMFADCDYLTYLDVRSFDFSKVIYSYWMFSCYNLQFILCNDDWSKSETIQNHYYMFGGCSELAGDHGTRYDMNNEDISYAHPDGGEENPGYFSKEVPVVFYAVFSEDKETVTFYYDNQVFERNGQIMMTNNKGYVWDKDRLHVQKAVFDESMKAARLTTLEGLFSGFEHLKTIEHLNYLNTSEVKNMRYMFWKCNELPSVDLRNFDISKVTNMNGMFAWCVSLKKIYCYEDWSKSAVLENSESMFANCGALVGGNGTAYDWTMVDVTYARPDGGTEQPGYFTAAYTHTVTIVAENGSVSVTEDVDMNNVPYGTTVHLTATPDDGYEFVGWTNYDPETGLEVMDDITVTAEFKKDTETALEDMEPNTPVQKIIRHGRLYIRHGNRLYDATGKLIVDN